jgi:hypothetical protein
MQPARDHQVQHEPKIALQSDGDSLSDSAQPLDPPPMRSFKRRRGSSEQKRTCHPDAFEPLIQDARLERLEVDSDVGKFGHDAAIVTRANRRVKVEEFRASYSMPHASFSAA